MRIALAALLLEEGWTDSKMSESSARILIEVLNRPFRGEFEFTEAYVNEVYRVTTKTLSKSMILQPEGGFVVRFIWSMFSMLAMLKAKADWYQELAEFLELEKTANVTTKSTQTVAS